MRLGSAAPQTRGPETHACNRGAASTAGSASAAADSVGSAAVSDAFAAVSDAFAAVSDAFAAVFAAAPGAGRTSVIRATSLGSADIRKFLGTC